MNTSRPDDQVTCPGCQGRKRMPAHNPHYDCHCCNGVGTIARERATRLRQIAADLRARAAEQGISLDDEN
jgi:DnaJ-class molecular chaperone